jgi:hypothetical protein
MPRPPTSPRCPMAHSVGNYCVNQGLEVLGLRRSSNIVRLQIGTELKHSKRGPKDGLCGVH